MKGRSRRDTLQVNATPDNSQMLFDCFELEVVAGPNQGQHKQFAQAVVNLGSARANDFQLHDEAISSFHCRIENHLGQIRLVDADSKNGTFVAGLQIREAFLPIKAQITIGNSQINFRSLGERRAVTLPTQSRLGNLIGTGPVMRQLFALITRAAPSSIAVVIEGETGTGKEVVARTIHDLSPRVEKPFEVLDCGAIPDQLIESELFGHVRGAFTGADRDHRGVFERANGGTVFLDELGELKLSLQPKLLRVLESGEIRRVGDQRTLKVDVRVIAATHKSLRALINANQFREDLYYRLAGCRLFLPPLRERIEDLPALVDNFLAALRLSSGQRIPRGLDPETLETFCKYSWPGNVRQLRNAVERLAVMGVVELTAHDSIANLESHSIDNDLTALPLKEAKEEFERRYLEALVKIHCGNMRTVAQAAQVHPKSIARMLRRYSVGI